MRIWAMLKTDHHITRDRVFAFDCPRPESAEEWHSLIKEMTGEFDISCPMLLKKHVADLSKFSRAVFKENDFIEPVDFDRFEIEILKEKKKTPAQKAE